MSCMNRWAMWGMLAAPWVVACSEAKETPQLEVDGGRDGGGEVDAVPVNEPAAPWNGCTGEDKPAGTTVVMAHDRADQFFSGWGAGENQRVVDASADFPQKGSWRRIFLRVDLECPADGQCDAWDRGATISLVEKALDKEEPIELVRHMTPYRVGLCFVLDVTDFASRLVGQKTIRSFIDTWVGPGHSSGHGWRVTTQFIFYPGAADSSAYASEVIPLWNHAAEDRLVDLGDPDQSLAKQLPERKVTIPANASAVKLRYLLTGHGQGNSGNCAEFCPLTHTTSFGSATAKITPWRDDCAANPLDTQYGSWSYPRAGWCPGSVVLPEIVDITQDVTPGTELALAYSIRDAQGNDFVNSCRPGAGNTQNQCEGCVFNSNAGNCDYDSNGHTPPYARVSVQLLVYRK